MKKTNPRTNRRRPHSHPLPKPRVVRRREWLPSLIWLIPIVAALVGITLVAPILLERGPEVVLTFKTAEGLEAGKTAVKYKDVQIGLVTHLRLARDRSHVRVLVQFNKEAESFTASDSRFWVVRPRLDTSGISGLNTLLSGAYIGADAGVSKDTAGEFTGLETRPSSRATTPASSSCCAPTTWVRSTLARRCTSGASRSGRWPPTNSTATGAA